MSKENQILDVLFELRRKVDIIEVQQKQQFQVTCTLINALQNVLAGKPGVDGELAAAITQSKGAEDLQSDISEVVYKDIAEMKHLTTKQHVVAQLVMRGWPNKMIGEVLNVSANTVKQHLRAVMKRFDVNSRGALGTRVGAAMQHMTEAEYLKASGGLGMDWHKIVEEHPVEDIEKVDPNFRLYRSGVSLSEKVTRSDLN